MNNLNDIIKAIQKQNETMQNISKLSSFNSLAESVAKMNQVNLHLGGITDTARSISRQMKIYNSFSNDFASVLNNQLAMFNQPALFGFSSSLAQIAKQNQLVSERLAGFATSWIGVSNNLAEMAKIIDQSHLRQFNTLSVALQGLSNDYLKKIASAKAWDEFEIAEEVNETISSIAEETIISTTQVTKEDLENFRTSIVNELSALFDKSKTERARQFILELIAVISFILTLYGTYHDSKEISNSEVIIETKREIEKLRTELSSQIATELNKLNKTRIARVNVCLRNVDKKNSKKIGQVKKGQIVTVIEIRHKYLLISYIDKDTKEPISGFVIKKYFDEIK